MLPASRSSNPPLSLWNLYRGSILAALALAAYAIFVGVALFAGWIAPTRAYALMALPCLVPVAWYARSFLKSSDSEADFGLLLSAVGWALIAFGLLIKDAIYARAQASAASGLGGDPESAPVATICFLLAFASLIAGTVLSLRAHDRDVDA